MKLRDYNICYFHLADLIPEEKRMMTKAEYEDYFKEPGSLKNRLVRYAKSNVGIGDVYGKLQPLLSEHLFVSVREVDRIIEWEKVNTIKCNMYKLF